VFCDGKFAETQQFLVIQSLSQVWKAFALFDDLCPADEGIENFDGKRFKPIKLLVKYLKRILTNYSLCLRDNEKLLVTTRTNLSTALMLCTLDKGMLCESNRGENIVINFLRTVSRIEKGSCDR